MGTDSICSRISDVARRLGVKPSTLRYWESEFPQLKPRRSEKGQRRYSKEDCALCEHIRELLYDKCWSAELVRRHLSATYRKNKPRFQFKCGNARQALRLLAKIRESVSDAHGLARIDAVERWISGREI